MLCKISSMGEVEIYKGVLEERSNYRTPKRARSVKRPTSRTIVIFLFDH